MDIAVQLDGQEHESDISLGSSWFLFQLPRLALEFSDDLPVEY